MQDSSTNNTSEVESTNMLVIDTQSSNEKGDTSHTPAPIIHKTYSSDSLSCSSDILSSESESDSALFHTRDTLKDMSVRDIQQKILNSVIKKNQDWAGKIMFKSFKLANRTLEFNNIIQYVGRQNKVVPGSCNIYFDPNKYPTAGGFNGSGFQELVKDLQIASIETGGFSLNKAGTTRLKDDLKGCFRFSCSRCEIYRGNPYERSNLNYRKLSFRNDKSNCRAGEGKTLPRKTTTKRALHPSQRCKFFFTVHYDTDGFYVLPNRGNPNHCHHPKIHKSQRNLPTRFSTETETDLIRDLSKADASLGVMRNAIHQKSGKYFSRQALFHIRGICQSMELLESDLRGCNSTDIMIKYLESKNYEYMMLIHSSQMSRIFHRAMKSPFANGIHSNVHFPDSEQLDADKFISGRRKCLNVPRDTQFMMAFAWTLPPEKLMFELFPHVVYVDTTADTNKEGRPLLTMSGKDSSSRVFTIIRAFLPNQQMWTFRWVFSVLLPKAFSIRTLSNVQVIITDGDSQETNQLDNALALYFPQARRVRCGWHIVNRSWNSNLEGPKSFPKNMRSLYEHVRHVCQTWIYSFMTPNHCETFHEYLLSKYLFLNFIGNPKVCDGIGETLSTHIQTWFKNYVEPHEQQFCFYVRKHLLHYGEYSNSAAEGGIHNSIKHCSTPVGPSHLFHRALTTLSKNAIRKIKEKIEKGAMMQIY